MSRHEFIAIMKLRDFKILNQVQCDAARKITLDTGDIDPFWLNLALGHQRPPREAMRFSSAARIALFRYLVMVAGNLACMVVCPIA